MKKFILFITLLIFPNYSFAQFNNDSILVTFKENVDSKFLNKLDSLISTKFIKLDNNKYKFKIDRIITNDLLDKYSEFFSIIKTVKDVEPPPSIKSSDEINNDIYIKNELPNKENTSNNTEKKIDEIKNENSDKTILTKISLNNQKNIRISFELSKKEDIKWIIEQLNGKIIKEYGFNSFIVRFQDNINPYIIIRSLKICSGILSVQLSN